MVVPRWDGDHRPSVGLVVLATHVDAAGTDALEKLVDKHLHNQEGQKDQMTLARQRAKWRGVCTSVQVVPVFGSPVMCTPTVLGRAVL